jgi:hypothetical protein
VASAIDLESQNNLDSFSDEARSADSPPIEQNQIDINSELYGEH